MTEDTPQAEVVIVGDDGTEHVFPAGFDPKQAAAIVRGGASPKEPRASESASRRPAVAMGWQAPGTFQTTDNPDSQEGIVSRTAKALAPMAQPESAEDLVGLALPSTVGMGAIKMGIPKGAAMMEKLGPKIAEAGDALKKHGPIAALIDVMTTHNPLQAAGVAAAPYGLEWAGRTMSKVGNAIKNFKPWEFDANPKVLSRLPTGTPEPWPIGAVPQPTRGLLGPGAERMPSGIVTPDQIINPRPMSAMPTGPIMEGEIVSDVRGALPPRRSVQLPSEMPSGQKAPGSDPSFVRAEPAQAAQVERSGPPSLRQEVERLSKDGLDAKTIADRLKDHPELAKATSKQERTNLVREARGGPSGQIPARAKTAIDEAIGNLKTIEEKRAYLMRAPNGQVYDYVKAKLGL